MSDEQLRLVMTYHQKSGRWLIKTSLAPLGPRLSFPPDKRIEALWREHAPNRGDLSMGNLLTGPTTGFYVEIGEGSTPQERERFLEALLAESPVSKS